MPDLTPEITSEVLKACNSVAGEAAEAFGRAFDLANPKLSVGEAGSYDPQALPDGFNGPGLVVLLTVEGSAALVVFPQSSGILPEWCPEPDPTGQSKLDTLAQELGMTLLPEDLMPTDFAAGWAKTLAGAIARGGVETGAAMLPLEITGGDKNCTATLIWPAPKPASVLGKGGQKPAAEKSTVALNTSSPQPQPKPQPAKFSSLSVKRANRVEDLPKYSRSLLKIEVPVIVTLAEKRQPLGKVVELCPGSIIHFEKSCEEMLDLDVGGHHVATGEAVKIGDKFGLRITSMVLPDERFEAVRPCV
ncbi:MAG: FliM/FliN family flagellar motor switch protein [Pirellulales bacterium]|nr:FliM/FliN family flagellar motor switch protein [Pirellulales bacterium]